MLKWFSIEGVNKETKRIRWPNTKEMAKSCAQVIIFCLLFALFFVGCELFVTFFIKMIGIGA